MSFIKTTLTLKSIWFLHFSGAGNRKCIEIMYWIVSPRFYWLVALCTTLLQNETVILTKCDSYFIRKCNKILLQNVPGFLLQNATVLVENTTVITKCDIYYKMYWYTFLEKPFYIIDELILKNISCNYCSFSQHYKHIKSFAQNFTFSLLIKFK